MESIRSWAISPLCASTLIANTDSAAARFELQNNFGTGKEETKNPFFPKVAALDIVRFYDKLYTANHKRR